MSLEIRRAAESDVPQVVALLREFAGYEDLLRFFEVTEEKLRTALFGETKVAEALVAVDGRRAVGYAVFFPNFASFRGQRGFYLEDIYVTKDYRGRGLGEAMLRRIAELGKRRGYERIDFQVLERNESAIGFYEALGAVRDDAERHFKFTDEAFRKLAERL